MLPALEALIALQALDSAADTARRRLVELPAAELAIAQRLDDAFAKSGHDIKKLIEAMTVSDAFLYRGAPQ